MFMTIMLKASLFGCYYVGKWLENGWAMVRDNNVGPITYKTHWPVFHLDVVSTSRANHLPTVIITLNLRWANYVLLDGCIHNHSFNIAIFH